MATDQIYINLDNDQVAWPLTIDQVTWTLPWPWPSDINITMTITKWHDNDHDQVAWLSGMNITMTVTKWHVNDEDQGAWPLGCSIQWYCLHRISPHRGKFATFAKTVAIRGDFMLKCGKWRILLDKRWDQEVLGTRLVIAGEVKWKANIHIGPNILISAIS